MQIIRKKNIHPPEADELAAQYAQAASQIRDLYPQRLRDTELYLADSWLGNAKNMFFSHFSQFPRDLNRFADQLDQIADGLRKIQVEIEVIEEIDDTEYIA